MVSVQTSLTSCVPSTSRKRKNSDGGGSESEKLSKEPKLEELLADSPLPIEWQRCLDIKSGKVHYYNTRTQVRTSEHPRAVPESIPVSLDLELNLAWSYPDVKIDSKADEDEDEEKEMMAIVCMQCHMLVMMSKASPSCPNCKFLHPPQPLKDHTSFFSPRFSLLHCKD